MAGSTVEIVLTADEADAVRAWRRLHEEGPAAYGKKLDEVKDKDKSLSDQMSESIDRAVRKYATLTGAAQLFLTTLKAIGQAEEERRRAGAAAEVSIDESLRKFQVQTGTPDSDAGAFRDRILSAATRNAVSNQQAAAAATQLASSGMSADMASGQALDVALGFMSATNAAGRDADPAQLIRAISQFNKGSGRGFDSGGLARSAVEVQRLFKGTDIQAGDLESLAKHAASLRMQGGIGASDQLATFSYLRDILGPDVGATAFSQSVTELSTAGADKRKTGLLRRLGLRPEDVDLKGEGLETAFSRLRGGMAGMNESQQAIFMAGLFGRESMRGATTMMDPSVWSEVARRRALMGDEEGYRRDIEIARGGSAAETRIVEAKAERSRASPEAAREENIAREYEEWINKQGAILRYTYKLRRFAMSTVGFSPSSIAHMDMDSPDFNAMIEAQNATARATERMLDNDEQRASRPAAAGALGGGN